MMGRNYCHIRSELRGLPLEGCVIFYRVTDGRVEITRVVSGERELDALFSDLDDG